MPAKREGHAKPGPKPGTVKIDGDWKDAVAHALKRGKPPSEPKKPKAKKKRNAKIILDAHVCV